MIEVRYSLDKTLICGGFALYRLVSTGYFSGLFIEQEQTPKGTQPQLATIPILLDDRDQLPFFVALNGIMV